jgi:hypothetical protein
MPSYTLLGVQDRKAKSLAGFSASVETKAMPALQGVPRPGEEPTYVTQTLKMNKLEGISGPNTVNLITTNPKNLGNFAITTGLGSNFVGAPTGANSLTLCTAFGDLEGPKGRTVVNLFSSNNNHSAIIEAAHGTDVAGIYLNPDVGGTPLKGLIYCNAKAIKIPTYSGQLPNNIKKPGCVYYDPTANEGSGAMCYVDNEGNVHTL